MELEKDLVIQILGSEEISELDFETRGALPGWNEKDVDFVYCKREIKLNKNGQPFKGHQTSEGEWMSIERLEGLLNEFKKKGATHISMEHHYDHIGYMFDYGTMRVATPEDIVEADLRDEKLKKSVNEKRIAELEKELETLKNE